MTRQWSNRMRSSLWTNQHRFSLTAFAAFAAEPGQSARTRTLGVVPSLSVLCLCASHSWGRFEDELNSGSAQRCQGDQYAGESRLSIPVFPGLTHTAMTHALCFCEWKALLVSSIPNKMLAYREALDCTKHYTLILSFELHIHRGNSKEQKWKDWRTEQSFQLQPTIEEKEFRVWILSNKRGLVNTLGFPQS